MFYNIMCPRIAVRVGTAFVSNGALPPFRMLYPDLENITVVRLALYLFSFENFSLILAFQGTM